LKEMHLNTGFHLRWIIWVVKFYWQAR
jgi:hypothetical protein